MTTIDDLLTAVPGLRRMRSINAPLLRVLLDRRRKECTWCGEPVAKGRSTWCGDVCVAAFKQRCDSNHARRLIEARDKGFCQLCWRDTLASEQHAKTAGLMKYLNRQRDESNEDYSRRVDERDAALLLLGYARGQWREVDHVLPVAEYGGLCGLDGLRLICGACHLEQTNQLAARGAKQRS